jgi:hypothetical protein
MEISIPDQSSPSYESAPALPPDPGKAALDVVREARVIKSSKI